MGNQCCSISTSDTAIYSMLESKKSMRSHNEEASQNFPKIISSRQCNIEVEYEMGKKLGEGTHGLVRKAYRMKRDSDKTLKVKDSNEDEDKEKSSKNELNSNKDKICCINGSEDKKRDSESEKDEKKSKENPVAVKKIKLATNHRVLLNLEREIEIIQMIHHPNLVDIYDTFKNHHSLYIVMEYCSGGQLLQKQQSYSELQIAQVMLQLLLAIKYLHELGISHRDLKPSNILFTNPRMSLNYDGPKDKQIQVKLIDFGVSRKQEKGPFHTIVGTPHYCAPEVIKGKYTNICDIWSLGVIFYQMLSGKLPFDSTDDFTLWKDIMFKRLTFTGKEWSHISPDAKNLCKKMLEKVFTKRITAEKCLKHRFFKNTLDYKLYSQLKGKAHNGHGGEKVIEKNKEIELGLKKLPSHYRLQLLKDIEDEKFTELAHLLKDEKKEKQLFDLQQFMKENPDPVFSNDEKFMSLKEVESNEINL
jgi:serine/threonine protein kinase